MSALAPAQSPLAPPAEETLDPVDWEALRELTHRIVDEALDYVRDVRDRPPWQDMPPEVKASFASGLPASPTLLSGVYREVSETVMRYPMGNIHPRFWSWYMGSSNFTGALGDFLAAVQGSNLGGGNHAAAQVERQVIDWFKEMMGFPASASGTLVSGGSVANLVALTVARNAKAGTDIREHGVGSVERPLRFYGSDQLHSCHRKSMETIGLGNAALRRVPSDEGSHIDIPALREAIAEDREAGVQPACIIGSAGTVNTGAIDNLEELAEVAEREGLWFHVDGCIGALIAIAPGNAWRVKGISRAHSIALDPHKWLHAPFEVGCVLIRDARTHRGTFALTPEYLEHTARGLASGEWLYDYGLQTTRGFRALKVWMSLKEHGAAKFGRLIDQNIAQAAYLAGLIEAELALELHEAREINIVCFRHRADALGADRRKAVNVEIMLRLQEQGLAVISDTTLKGEHWLRVAVNNHRTRREDLELLVREVLRIGGQVIGDLHASGANPKG
mgnify:CR=1 FL=1